MTSGRRILAIDPGVCPCACLIVEGNGCLDEVCVWEGASTSVRVAAPGRRTRATMRLGHYVWRPSSALLAEVIDAAQPDFVVIEDVGTRPKQGIVSAFTFGFASGLIEGVVVGRGVPVLRVRPQVWKAELLFPPGAIKAYSRHIATMIGGPDFAHLFKRVKDHNRADAFCMAYWGREYDPREPRT